MKFSLHGRQYDIHGDKQLEKLLGDVVTPNKQVLNSAQLFLLQITSHSQLERSSQETEKRKQNGEISSTEGDSTGGFRCVSRTQVLIMSKSFDHCIPLKSEHPLCPYCYGPQLYTAMEVLVQEMLDNKVI